MAGVVHVWTAGPLQLEQTYVFWALSTIIFILTVTLGFMLFRTFVKLYIERQANRVGSHIRSKLVGGALALSFLPVLFLVLWSFTVLNYNLAKWFSIPGQHIKLDLVDVGQMIDGQMHDKLRAQGHWMALLLGSEDRSVYQKFCAENHIDAVGFRAVTGNLQAWRTGGAKVSLFRGGGGAGRNTHAFLSIAGRPGSKEAGYRPVGGGLQQAIDRQKQLS